MSNFSARWRNAWDFEDECFRESVDHMIDAALDSKNPVVARALTASGWKREGHVTAQLRRQTGLTLQQSPFLPFAEGNFATPSGKAELYSESLNALGLHPVVDFTPPAESRHGAQAKSFPLEMLARKADNFLNSTFSNLPVTQQMEELGLLEMNAIDARARGIANGDRVRVFNGRGEILLTARVDGAVQPGWSPRVCTGLSFLPATGISTC